MMRSVIHDKVVRKLKDKSFAADFVKDECFVRWCDYLKVCHHQRLTSAEARVFVNELQVLGLVEKLDKNNIKILI